MRVRHVLLYTAVGLLLTCAVALACSYRSQRGVVWYNTDSELGCQILTGTPGIKWHYSGYRMFGTTLLMAQQIENDNHWELGLYDLPSKPAHAPRYFVSALRREEQSRDAHRIIALKMKTFGLPFRCLYYSQRSADDLPIPDEIGRVMESIHITTHGGYDVSKNGAYEPLVLPFGILWLGMLANTLLFAGLSLITLRGPSWFIRRRRLRLGCCLNCGYSRAGNTSPRCPECGATSPI